MVMLPPWSNPDPATVPLPAKKAATKKPAKKAAAKAPTAPKPTVPAKNATAKKATAAKKTAPPAEPPVTPPPQASSPERPARTLGQVEQAVYTELHELGVGHSALAAAALLAARRADEADTASGTAAALRELRMTLPLAKTTVNPLSPPAPAEKPAEEGDNVVSPDRLEVLRKRGARRAAP
jgi:hypothetical protein